MSRQDDIYRKDTRPSLHRKSRAKNRRVRRAGRTGETADGQVTDSTRRLYEPKEKKRLRMEGLAPRGRGGRRRSGRRRRTERRKQQINLLLWVGLGAIIVVYMGFLASSYLKETKRNKLDAAKANLPPAEAPEVMVAPGRKEKSNIQAKQIREKIKNWNQAGDVLEEARVLMVEGRLDKVEQNLLNALKNSPKMVELKLALAKVYMQKHELSKAETLCLEILDTIPDKNSAKLTLASILLQLQQYESALTVSGWVLENDPYSFRALQIVASAYLNSDRPALAIPHLRKLVSLDRDNVVAFNNLAVAYSRIGQFSKAEKVFRDVLRGDDRNPVTYFNLAVCFALQKRGEKTVEVLNRASNLFGPSFVATWLESEKFGMIRNYREFESLKLDLANMSKEGDAILQPAMPGFDPDKMIPTPAKIEDPNPDETPTLIP